MNAISSVDTESEQIVLASLIDHESIMYEIDLQPEHFSNEAHEKIFLAIKGVMDAKQAVSPLTVAEQLERSGAFPNPSDYIKRLMRAASGMHTMAPEYSRMIRDNSVRRKAISEAVQLQTHLSKKADLSIIDETIGRLMNLSKTSGKYSHTFKEVVTSALKRMQEVHERGEGLLGITSGLTDFDDLTGGFQDTFMYVIAGRPAMGKTAFALTNYRSMLHAGHKPGLISSEQAGDEIGQRSLASEAKISLQTILNATLVNDEWGELSRASHRLFNVEGYVNDEPSITIDGVERQAREWVYRYGCDCLLVDYLQRIRVPSIKERREEVGEVARRLKSLGKELKVPVIVLAQLNRDCEKRPDKRPVMSDLGDSGEIEREADMICFLYRDVVYNPDTDFPEIAEILIGKNRHGPVGRINSQYHGPTLRFLDLVKDRYAQMAQDAGY